MIGLFLYLQNYLGQLPFLLGDVTQLEGALNNQNDNGILLNELRPGYSIILLNIYYITGIPILFIVMMPIGIILIPLLYFIVVKKINSDFYSALILGIFMLFIVGQSNFYNAFAYAWTWPLFLSSLILLLILLFNNTINKFFIIFLIIIIFLSSSSIHHAQAIWIITIFFTVLIYQRRCSIRHNYGISLIILLIISFLFINQVFYQVFIPSMTDLFVTSDFDYPIQKLLGQIIGGLLRNDVELDQFEIVRSSGLFGNLRLVLNGILIITVCILLLNTGYLKITKLNTRKLDNLPDDKNVTLKAICNALFITIFIQASLYAVVLRFSNQFLILGGPLIIAAYIVINKKYRKKLLIILIALMTLSVATFILSASNIDDYPSINNMKSGSTWIVEKINDDHLNIIGDINSRYYVEYYLTLDGRSVNHKIINGESYKSIVEGESMSDCEYFIIDEYSYKNAVTVEGLKEFEPFANYYPQISNNNHLNNVYSSNNMNIFTCN